MNAFERPLLAAAVLWVGIIPAHAQNASSFTATPPDAPLPFFAGVAADGLHGHRAISASGSVLPQIETRGGD